MITKYKTGNCDFMIPQHPIQLSTFNDILLALILIEEHTK